MDAYQILTELGHSEKFARTVSDLMNENQKDAEMFWVHLNSVLPDVVTEWCELNDMAHILVLQTGMFHCGQDATYGIRIKFADIKFTCTECANNVRLL